MAHPNSHEKQELLEFAEPTNLPHQQLRNENMSKKSLNIQRQTNPFHPFFNQETFDDVHIEARSGKITLGHARNVQCVLSLLPLKFQGSCLRGVLLSQVAQGIAILTLLCLVGNVHPSECGMAASSSPARVPIGRHNTF